MNRLSRSRIRTARAPSANGDRLPARCDDRDVRLRDAREHRVDVADDEHQRRGPRILNPQRQRAVIDVLDLHELDVQLGCRARAPTGAVRARPGCRTSRRAADSPGYTDAHPTRAVAGTSMPNTSWIERQRAVHVLDERRERAGADHGADDGGACAASRRGADVCPPGARRPKHETTAERSALRAQVSRSNHGRPVYAESSTLKTAAES